ncbi:hypothetical protein ACSBR2_020184 [Camellia fascicularis]
MALIQESKKSCVDERFVRSIWPYESMDFMAVDTVGTTGTIHLSIDRVTGNIYAPNDVLGGRNLWDALTNLKGFIPKLWCLGGNFNEIRVVRERKRCVRRDRGMANFGNFVNNPGQMDTPMLGRQYTCRNTLHWSRIDRFLVNPERMEWFKFKFWVLHRVLLDHCPILLMEDERDWRPKPFRFINAWVLHQEFLKEVKKVWDNAKVEGWDRYIIMGKLRALKVALKKWNVEVFENVDFKLKEAEMEFHTLDLIAEVRSLNKEEFLRRKEVKEMV